MMPETLSSDSVPADSDPRIRRLLAYWQARRPDENSLPARRDIRPVDLTDIIRWIWLVDVQREPLRFKYRLLGSELVFFMERDFTGHWLDEAHPKFERSTAYKDYLDAALSGRIGYHRGPSTFAHLDKSYLNIERILLPLAQNGRDVDMLLGMTLNFSKIG